VILPQVNQTRDAAVAMALILQYMLESGKRIGELASEVPKYHIEKRKVGVRTKDFKKVAQSARRLQGDGDINKKDGIRIDWDDSWLHIRPSGTEPVIRIIAEAKTQQKAKLIANEAARLIAEL
jgi:phosphomannomutase